MAKKYYIVKLFGAYEGCNISLDWKDREYSGVIHTRIKDARDELKQAKKEAKELGYDDACIMEIENG